jgi:hypothetical protein
MASVSSNNGESLVVGGWNPATDEPSNSDRYLARRLEAAGADYKGVALTNFLLGAAVAASVWLAVGVLAEHWIVPGGLPRTVRWGWLAVGLGALVAAAIRWLLPLVRYRVNLVYAARAIEREHPELHNDLVNTVLVKAHPEGSTAVVVRSLEKRAAKRLADVPSEGVIDRTLAVRLALALAAGVGIACLYELIAPKSLLVSAVRLVAPWAGISAPSRVRIDPPRLHWRMPGAGFVDPQQFDGAVDGHDVAVDRGSATLVRGRQLVLAAAIRGLRGGEQPIVHAVPLRDDGSPDPAAPPWRIEMVRGAAEGEAAKVFTAFLPDATRGLENAVEITIAAGDARSEPIRLVVVDSPSLLVREVRYDFPAYIGRDPETVAWQGDLRAPEEAQVTLVAECNQPIEAAWIDFGCDGNRDLKMKVGASDLARASVTFPLRLNADRTAPEHSKYRLVFQPRGATPQGGREAVVVEPMEHRIEVIADLAPEVTIEAPVESPLAVPRDAPVPVRVRAVDPDHALVRVAIETRVDGGRAAPPIPILESTKQGPFKGTARLVPFNLGAEAGSVLQYRAVATDNRAQQPNVSVTPWQELKIDEKAPPQPDEPEPDFPKDSKKGRSGEDRSDASDRGDEGDDAGQDGDEQPEGGRDQDRQREGGDGAEEGAGQPRPDDGGRDDGASGGQDRQDQDRQDQDQQNQDPQQRGAPADRKRSDRQRNDDGSNPPPPGEQGQPGASGGGDEQQGDGKQQRPGNDQSPKGSKPGKNGSPQQGADGGDSGDQQGSGQKPGSQQKGSEGKERAQAGEDEGQGEGQQREGGEKPQPGAKPSSSGGAGKKRQNDAVAADGTNDGEAMDRILERRRRDSKQGEGQKGEGQKGEGQQGEGQKGEGQQGEGQKGEGQQGEGQQGEGQKGEGQQGEGQQGEGQQGEGQKGEGQKGEGQKGEGQGSGGEGEQGEGGEKPGGKAKPGGEQSQPPKSPTGNAKAGGAEEGDEEGGGGADPQQQADGQPGSSASPTGSGGWSNGDGPPPDKDQRPDGEAPKTEAEWGDQDTAHARNAADLAVRELKDDLEKGRTDLLDELGWTRDQAKAFLQRWEAMRALEKSNDPVKRGEFDRALRSLGLRPDGVRSKRDVPADIKGGQAEGRRSRPPSEYREQFKAYTQGTTGE